MDYNFSNVQLLADIPFIIDQYAKGELSPPELAHSRIIVPFFFDSYMYPDHDTATNDYNQLLQIVKLLDRLPVGDGEE